MNKFTALALVGAVCMAAPAFARTAAEIEVDIKASKEAIKKDEAALKKYEDELARDRSAKADAKASGDMATQAQKSVEIGADKTMIQAKKAEKKIDEKILEHDQNKEASPSAGSKTTINK